MPTPSACSRTSTARCGWCITLCGPSTRIIIAYYSHLWEPVLKLAEALRAAEPQPQINYVATVDFLNLMDLADFEVISQEQRQLIPRRWFGLGPFINRFIAPLPVIRQLCLRNYVVGARRSAISGPQIFGQHRHSLPQRARQYRGGGEADAAFCSAHEIIFVEGNSSDGTFEECERVRDAYPDSWDIKVLKQDGKGKGDAVRKGFAAATGDVLMILDADLTMPPEDLPKFYAAIASGQGRVRQRLAAGLSDGRRRRCGSSTCSPTSCFALAVQLAAQPALKDTLCGTKVLLRKRLRADRARTAPTSATSIRSATST